MTASLCPNPKPLYVHGLGTRATCCDAHWWTPIVKTSDGWRSVPKLQSVKGGAA